MAPTTSGPETLPPTRQRASARVLSLLAAATLVVGLSACGASGEEGGDTTTTTVATGSGTDGSGGEPEPGPDETSTTTSTTSTPDVTTTTVGPRPGPVAPLPELDPAAQVYADALAADLREDSPAGTDPECLATRWVDAIGIERLQAKDLTVEEFMDDGPAQLDLDRETALAMADAMEPCGITLDSLIESFGGVGTDMECLRSRVSNDDLRDFFAAGFMGEEPEDGPFPDAIEACTEEIEIEGSGPGS